MFSISEDLLSTKFCFAEGFYFSIFSFLLRCDQNQVTVGASVFYHRFGTDIRIDNLIAPEMRILKKMNKKKSILRIFKTFYREFHQGTRRNVKISQFSIIISGLSLFPPYHNYTLHKRTHYLRSIPQLKKKRFIIFISQNISI